MNPAALTIDEFAELMAKQGDYPRITAVAVREKLLPAGLPVCPQSGTISLVEAVAWMAGQV